MNSNGVIDCRSFEERIHQLLDDRLTLAGDELLMSHVAHCADCERIFRDYESVDDSVKLLPAEIATLVSPSQTHPVSARQSSRRIWAAASLAAIFVISMNIFYGRDLDQPDSTRQVASNSAAPQVMLVAPRSSFPAVSPRQHKRPTPDTSPFSPNFSVVDSMPTIPTVPSWDKISRSLDPLEPALLDPVISYSSKIPAVRPVHCSINATMTLLKTSLSKQDEPTRPDLGFSIDPDLLAAV